MKILLTGATGGIGQALAKALAADGDYLLLQGRNRQRLELLETTLGAEHCTTVVADLNNPQDREALVERAGKSASTACATTRASTASGRFLTWMSAASSRPISVPRYC
jgi:short-subunit dehydrogenase